MTGCKCKACHGKFKTESKCILLSIWSMYVWYLIVWLWWVASAAAWQVSSRIGHMTRTRIDVRFWPRSIGRDFTTTSIDGSKKAIVSVLVEHCNNFLSGFFQEFSPFALHFLVVTRTPFSLFQVHAELPAEKLLGKPDLEVSLHLIWFKKHRMSTACNCAWKALVLLNKFKWPCFRFEDWQNQQFHSLPSSFCTSSSDCFCTIASIPLLHKLKIKSYQSLLSCFYQW